MGLLGEDPRAVDDDLSLPQHGEKWFLVVKPDQRRHVRAKRDRQRTVDLVGHLSVELEARSAMTGRGVEPDDRAGSDHERGA